MGFNGQLILTEYLPNEEFCRGTPLQACRAMVFPSLFEGFGMRCWRQWRLTSPVLCSNVTSLPEVVGDAAVLFDPRKPTEIVQAIEQVESDPKLVAQLIQHGRNRLAAFDDVTGMARRYLHVLQDAIGWGQPSSQPARCTAYSHGWLDPRARDRHAQSGQHAALFGDNLLRAPWLPSETLSIRAGEHRRT